MQSQVVLALIKYKKPKPIRPCTTSKIMSKRVKRLRCPALSHSHWTAQFFLNKCSSGGEK